ncbi:MAG: hypothetical protein ACKPBT_07965 [Microcystis aeruginosa]
MPHLLRFLSHNIHKLLHAYISYQLSVISCQLSVISYQLSVYSAFHVTEVSTSFANKGFKLLAHTSF